MYKENRTYKRNVNMANRNNRPAVNSLPIAARSSPIPPPVPSLPPIPVPPFTPTGGESATKLQAPLTSIPLSGLQLPEAVSSPPLPELKLPKAVSLPPLPEIKLPEAVSLPPLPELKLPEVSAPPLKELKLPESVPLPSFSLDELKFPEIPPFPKADPPSPVAPKAAASLPQAPPAPPPAKEALPQPPQPQILPPAGIPPQIIPPQILPASQIPIGKYARIRFLNASNHSTISVLIGTGLGAKSLGRGEVSPYVGVLDGFRTITVTSPSITQPVLLRKTLPIKGGEVLTMALISTQGGLELLSISDAPCERHPSSLSCIRMVNLAAASKPLDLLLSDGRVIFADVSYKDVTPFKRIKPGKYRFFVIHTPYQPLPLSEDIEVSDAASVSADALPDQCERKILLSFMTEISSNKMYTMYILSSDHPTMPLEVLIVENKLP